MRLSPGDGTLLPDPTIYLRLVGRFIYLTVTRPYINYVVHVLSQFMLSPRNVHLDAAYRVVRYLRGSIAREFFSHLLTVFTCTATVILIGPVAPSLASPQLGIVPFLVQVSFLGRPRNMIRFRTPPLRPNTVPWRP